MKKKLNENNEEVEGLNIPLSVGPLLTSYDKKNQKCLIVDIVFHPQVLDDIFSANQENFKPSNLIASQQDAINFKHFICQLSMNSVEKKYKLKINPKYKFMKMKYFYGYEDQKEHKIPSQWIEDRKNLPKIEEVTEKKSNVATNANKNTNKKKDIESDINKIELNLDLSIAWFSIIEKNLVNNFKNLESFYQTNINSYVFPSDFISEFLIDYDKMDKNTFLTNFTTNYEEIYKSLIKYTHFNGNLFYPLTENDYFINNFDFDTKAFTNLNEEHDEDDIKYSSNSNQNDYLLLWKNFDFKQIKDEQNNLTFTHNNNNYTEEMINIPAGMTAIYLETRFESQDNLENLKKSIKILINSYKIEIDNIKNYKKKTFYFGLNFVPIKFFYNINVVEGYINFKKLNIIIFYELNSLNYNYNSYDYGSKLWQLSNALSDEIKESDQSNENLLSFLKSNTIQDSNSSPNNSSSYAEDRFHLKLPDNVDPYTGLEYAEGQNTSQNPDDWILPEDKFHKKDISSQHIIAQREQARKDKWEKYEK